MRIRNRLKRLEAARAGGGDRRPEESQVDSWKGEFRYLDARLRGERGPGEYPPSIRPENGRDIDRLVERVTSGDPAGEGDLPEGDGVGADLLRYAHVFGEMWEGAGPVATEPPPWPSTGEAE